jgi:hypothetical protein
MRYLGRTVISIAVFSATFTFLAFAGSWVQENTSLSYNHGSEGAFILYLLLMPVIPVALAHACAVGVWRVWRPAPEQAFGQTRVDSSARHRWGKPLVTILIVAYLLTWMFGVPSVQSSLTNDAVAAYKKMRTSYPQEVSDGHPYVKSYVAFPVLPGLIVTYHEYQVAYLYGFGGWEWHLWYLTGAKPIFSRPRWVS